jgi:hypothetical protein
MCPADATLEGKRADPTHQQNAALLPAKRRARECIGRAAAVQKTQRSRGRTGLGRAHSLDIQAEAPHVARRGECVDTPWSVGYGQTAAIARVESENIHWLQSGAKEETCQAAPRDQNGTERPESLVGCMAGSEAGATHNKLMIVSCPASKASKSGVRPSLSTGAWSDTASRRYLSRRGIASSRIHKHVHARMPHAV